MPLLISRLILNLREFEFAGNSTSLASAGGEKTVTVMFASAPGTDSDSDSDSGSSKKGGVSEFESSGFAAFVDPLGAPVDDALDWYGLEEDAITPAMSTASDKSRLFAQERCEADDRC